MDGKHRKLVPTGGERLVSTFNEHCAKCHGVNGEGSPGNDLTPEAPDLTGKKWKHDLATGHAWLDALFAQSGVFESLPDSDNSVEP